MNIAYILAFSLLGISSQNITIQNTQYETQLQSEKQLQIWGEVPYIMQPGSIILYDDDCNPTIIQGGCLDVPYIEETPNATIDDFMAKIPETASEEEKKQIEWENEVIRQAFNDVDLTHPNYPKIEIIPGMKVVYNEITGDIDNIYYRDSFCGGYTIHGEAEHLK